MEEKCSDDEKLSLEVAAIGKITGGGGIIQLADTKCAVIARSRPNTLRVLSYRGIWRLLGAPSRSTSTPKTAAQCGPKVTKNRPSVGGAPNHPAIDRAER